MIINLFAINKFAQLQFGDSSARLVLPSVVASSVGEHPQHNTSSFLDHVNTNTHYQVACISTD